METTNCYTTKDLGEASFLVASGIKLIQIEKENKVCWFMFADKDGCRKLSDSFFRREAVINVQDFLNSTRMLKDIIFRKER